MGRRILFVCLSVAAGITVADGQGLSPGTPAKEYVRFNGQVIAVEVPTYTCTYTLTPGSQSFGVNGGSGSITVTTGAGCAWTASPGASWIVITGGSSGQGNGTVSYSLSANGGISSRNGIISIGSQTFTITEAGTGPSSPALRFVPVTPCRLVDTRNPNGPFGGPAFSAGETRTYTVPSGPCGIPATAQAFSLNLAVLPSAATNVTVWPAGEPQPSTTSLNSDGRNKSNAAIVAAGNGGAISVYVTGSTGLLIDISGYFAPATGLAFYPITPCRVADTRNANGLLGGPYLSAGKSRAFPILSSACGIPSSAQAYSLNLSALPRGPLIYLTAWPGTPSTPPTSTLNAPTGTDTANAAIVQADSSGNISIYTSNDTDLIIDVNGYFAPAGSGGLSLYASYEPCRVYDSRLPVGSPPFSGTISAPVAGGSCGLPSSAQAYVLNAAALPSGSLVFLELWANGQAQPNYSTLNAIDGAITSNMAVVGSSNGSINAYASSSTHLVLDAYGYFAP